MKNFISKLTIITLATIAALACQKEAISNPEPIWEDATSVACFNINKIHTKSGLASMDLSKLGADLNIEFAEHPSQAALLKAIVRNPNASGFDLNKPAYIAYGKFGDDVNKYQVIISVMVASATDVDNLLTAFKDEGNNYTASLDGDKRIFKLNNEPLIVGYDSKRLVAIYAPNNEECDLQSVLLKHMQYDAADMSRFGNYDAAMYININEVYDAVYGANGGPTENMLEEDIETIETPFGEYISDNASAIAGVIFDNGSISCDVELNGVSDKTANLFKSANAQSYNMLKPSPIAVLNMGVNGEAFAELANTAIKAATEVSGGASNEFNIFKNIALGVIGSINGDLTMALSDADGTISEDALGDKRLLFTKAEALFTAEVTDNYIMKNVESYASSFLKKSGNKYKVEAFGNDITIGQNDNLFYVGINNNGEKLQTSAANEEWMNNVTGSYIFAMVDFNRFFKSGFGKQAISFLKYNIVEQSEEHMTLTIIDSIDRAYITVNGYEDVLHSEVMLTLNEKSKNSLQYIIETFYGIYFN